MPKADHIYEIEMKALLSQEQYDSLRLELPKHNKLVTKETLHTKKFKTREDNDIRLRYSEQRYELVYKKGHATDLARKEITIKLASKQELDNFATVLRILDFAEDPSWITHRMDFEYPYEGHIYSVSLQDTENFAKILEVEFASINEEDIGLHEKKIKAIITKLGCEPIKPQEFSEQINKYIQENQRT